MRVLFIVDEKQARQFLALDETFDEIFSLDPQAAYLMKKAGHKVVSPADYYGSASHAKTALNVAGMVDKIAACGTQAYVLNDGEVSGFRANLIYILNLAYYLFYATRHYGHKKTNFSLLRGGIIEHFANYELAFPALLELVARRYNIAYEKMDYTLWHYKLARLCNRLTLSASNAAKKFRILHFGDSALNDIEAAIAAQIDTVVFKPRALGKSVRQTLHIAWQNYGKLRRGERHVHIFRTIRPGHYQGDYSEKTREFARLVDGLGLSFPHPIFRERIINDSGWYMPFFKSQMLVGENLARDLSPQLTMTNKGKYHFIRAAIYYADKAGGKSILINHGTHTAQKPGSLSQVAANLWASDDRICLKDVSYVVPKLPLTERQVKEIYAGDLPEFIHIPTVKRIEKDLRGDPNEQFTIMFAGNYFGPLYHIPWCAETADEYLLGLYQLIEEFGGMEKVDFIIKLKARKAGMHIAMLQEKIDALGVGDRVRIDTDTPFLEALSRTHLVVSNLSTTVEEAVTNHIPLLLHSYRKHYFHLPCQFDVAADGSGGLVYGVARGGSARVMAEEIRRAYPAIAAHRAENDGLVWSAAQTNDLPELAARITTQTFNKSEV